MNNRLNAVRQAIFWLRAATLPELRNYLGWRMCPDRECAHLVKTGELFVIGDFYYVRGVAS